MASHYQGVEVPDTCKQWIKIQKEYTQVGKPHFI